MTPAEEFGYIEVPPGTHTGYDWKNVYYSYLGKYVEVGNAELEHAEYEPQDDDLIYRWWWSGGPTAGRGGFLVYRNGKHAFTCDTWIC